MELFWSSRRIVLLLKRGIEEMRDEFVWINSCVRLGAKVLPPVGTEFVFVEDFHCNDVLYIESIVYLTLFYRVKDRPCYRAGSILLDSWLRDAEIVGLPNECLPFEDWKRF